MATVKNTLFAVKHGFAYALCCTPRRHHARTSSAGLVARFIERENKGLSRLESFFLGTIFQNSTKSFPFGVSGWPRRRAQSDKIDEWQIDGFHSLTEEENKRDAHKVFYVSRVGESYL